MNPITTQFIEVQTNFYKVPFSTFRSISIMFHILCSVSQKLTQSCLASRSTEPFYLIPYELLGCFFYFKSKMFLYVKGYITSQTRNDQAMLNRNKRRKFDTDLRALQMKISSMSGSAKTRNNECLR